MHGDLAPKAPSSSRSLAAANALLPASFQRIAVVGRHAVTVLSLQSLRTAIYPASDFSDSIEALFRRCPDRGNAHSGSTDRRIHTLT